MPPARRSTANTRKYSKARRRSRPCCTHSDRRAGFAALRSLRSDIERVGGEIRKVSVPMVRDLQPRRHPGSLMIHDVVEKPHQRGRAARTADNATMQAHRHHLGRRLAFGVQHVKTVLEVGEELIAATEPLRVDEAHIVCRLLLEKKIHHAVHSTQNSPRSTHVNRSSTTSAATALCEFIH